MFALFFYSMPSFLLGLLLLYFLYFRLTLAGLAVVPGRRLRAAHRAASAPGSQHLVLPWITLALLLGGDVHPADPRLDARRAGRGLHPDRAVQGHRARRRVIVRHGLRSALTPVVTQFGIDLGTLLGGVVVIETVFSLPGPRARPRSTRSTSRTCR